MLQILNRLHANQWVVMGILNVTPDSFSDGGRFNHLDKALEHALTLEKAGANILDIGGESTRPGARSVTVEDEINRVVPVITAIRRQSAIPISIDTSKPAVMRAAVAAGAGMINDVNALRADGALQTCADLAVPVCLMHKQGDPQTMQENPHYENTVADVQAFLRSRIRSCLHAGIPQTHISIDPGFGFGKRLDDNMQLLAHIDTLVAMSYPVLVGVSRKSMFGTLLGLPVEQRMCSSVAAAVLAYERGARFFRVHDVKETVDALRLCAAIEMVDKVPASIKGIIE